MDRGCAISHTVIMKYLIAKFDFFSPVKDDIIHN
jgi:hypothetical protein